MVAQRRREGPALLRYGRHGPVELVRINLLDEVLHLSDHASPVSDSD